MNEEVSKFWNKIAWLMKEQEKTVFSGTVSAVDEKNRTCSVQVENVTYEEVKLYGIVQGDLKGFCFIPKTGSHVLVARIGGSNELFVAMFTEVERAVLTIGENTTVEVSEECVRIQSGESTVKATEKGLTFVKGGAGLKKTLEALIDAITKLTVTTGVGPSGVPINVVDFVKIKQGLNDYLEG